jgi:DNA polymerase III delta prime subunit
VRGVAREVAGILALKIQKLLSAEHPVRILFYGPPGTGKTALAAWLASQLAGHATNVDRKSGKQIGVEQVRRWMATLGIRPIHQSSPRFADFSSTPVPAGSSNRNPKNRTDYPGEKRNTP